MTEQTPKQPAPAVGAPFAGSASRFTPRLSQNSLTGSWQWVYTPSLWRPLEMPFQLLICTKLPSKAFYLPQRKHFLGTLSLMLLVPMLFGNPWAYIRGLLLHLLGFLTFLLSKKWGHCIFCANFTDMSCFSYLKNEMCNQILFVSGVPNCSAMIECTE